MSPVFLPHSIETPVDHVSSQSAAEPTQLPSKSPSSGCSTVGSRQTSLEKVMDQT